jgi:SAM-dependent methyltransferase
MSEAIPQFLYDKIGPGYARHRHPDKRIVAALHTALGDAVSVVNVGAGSGAYEPTDRHLIAVEPSTNMLALRGPTAAPAVQARAEALPFNDRCVDAVLAVLTIHHWADQAMGLRECARIARARVVVFTWDPTSEGFWLVQDYLPAFLAHDRTQFPSIETLCTVFGPSAHPEISPVPIPYVAWTVSLARTGADRRPILIQTCGRESPHSRARAQPTSRTRTLGSHDSPQIWLLEPGRDGTARFTKTRFLMLDIVSSSRTWTDDHLHERAFDERLR